MILPIVLYGDPMLKTNTKQLTDPSNKVQELVKNLFETMSIAEGIGLAAHQVGQSVSIFVVNTTPVEKKREKILKQVFINSEILSEEGDPWLFEEGCLSIPGVREKIARKPVIKIRFLDENWKTQVRTFDGISARVIQHEYDHIKGKLLTDHLSPLKKRLLKNKLSNIHKGNVSVNYPIKLTNNKN